MSSKHMLCLNCMKARYETINMIVKGISLKAEYCPKCHDIVYTPKQSLALDKLRWEKAEEK